jgi:biotin operon repressor
MQTERTLALVLGLPIHPPVLPPANADGEIEVPESTLTLLKEIEQAGAALQERMNELAGDSSPLPFLNTYALFHPTLWFGNDAHESCRRRLIDTLWNLRAELLDTLRQLPPPPTGIDPGQLIDAEPRQDSWRKLTPRQRDILTVLAGDQLSGKEIAQRLKLGEDNVAHRLAELRKLGVLGNKRTVGYWIQRAPDGAPPEIRARLGSRITATRQN